jgi:hypothetical protein
MFKYLYTLDRHTLRISPSLSLASAHLYPYFCADLSLAGLVTSPFLAMAPHCRAIAWLQKTSTTVIENMWVLLGTWTAAQLIPNPKMLQTADNAS